MAMNAGPLGGVRVIELGGIGPVPFAGMLLADLGADVVKIDRPGGGGLGVWSAPRYDILARNRRSIVVDVKNPAGREIVLRLTAHADALIEGFRPGVAEKLGVGPDDCRCSNPRLVYGRMTGWGQSGPRASTAGHDINYIAVTGALHAIGSADGPPVPPLNLIGDFGGGALYLALGVVSAILEARGSGRGQTVDAAMVDGSASLMAALYGAFAIGYWHDGRGCNLLDGGAPFYGVYETRDNRHVAVGAIEPQFYAALLSGLGLEESQVAPQHDRDAWPATRDLFATVFASKTLAEWSVAFDGTDACVTPVRSMGEASSDPHLSARRTFIEVDGVSQPGPAPRFSRSDTGLPRPPAVPGAHTRAVLAEIGYAPDGIAELLATGVVVSA